MLHFRADLGSPLAQLIWVEFLVGDHDCEVEELMGKLLVFCENAVLAKRKHKNDCILKELNVKYFQQVLVGLTSVFDSTKMVPCSSLDECLQSIFW